MPRPEQREDISFDALTETLYNAWRYAMADPNVPAYGQIDNDRLQVAWMEMAQRLADVIEQFDSVPLSAAMLAKQMHEHWALQANQPVEQTDRERLAWEAVIRHAFNWLSMEEAERTNTETHERHWQKWVNEKLQQSSV